MRSLRPALTLAVLFFLFAGLAFPLGMTALCQAVFPASANGSLVYDAQGKPIGSTLIGQSFAGRKYLHGRPSAAGDGYDASKSSGTNLSPAGEKHTTSVQELMTAYRKENGLSPSAPVPVDAVTASASGLDPQISPENAQNQIPRIAKARGVPEAVVRKVIDQFTARPAPILGDSTVDVLRVNIALDQLPRSR